MAMELQEEYSELITYGERWYVHGKHGDNIQNIVSNLVDLVENYGDDVYKADCCATDSYKVDLQGIFFHRAEEISTFAL